MTETKGLSNGIDWPLGVEIKTIGGTQAVILEKHKDKYYGRLYVGNEEWVSCSWYLDGETIGRSTQSDLAPAKRKVWIIWPPIVSYKPPYLVAAIPEVMAPGWEIQEITEP